MFLVFDATPSCYDDMSKSDKRSYEKLLKEGLMCWNCELPMKNLPTLKTHLQEEWDKLAKREKARAERKRKLDPEGAEHPEKKLKPDTQL